jgi:hypothetical protein
MLRPARDWRSCSKDRATQTNDYLPGEGLTVSDRRLWLIKRLHRILRLIERLNGARRRLARLIFWRRYREGAPRAGHGVETSQFVDLDERMSVL